MSKTWRTMRRTSPAWISAPDPNQVPFRASCGMFFVEHLHLSLGVESLGAAFNLASMIPWAAVAYGVAVLDASYATSLRTSLEPLAYLNHFSQIRRVVDLSWHDHGSAYLVLGCVRCILTKSCTLGLPYLAFYYSMHRAMLYSLESTILVPRTASSRPSTQ